MPMITDMPQNRFKRGLKSGTPQIGLWMSLTSPVAAEIVAGAGYDWMLLDMEHSANDLPEIGQQLRAAVGGTAEPVVRAPWNDFVMIKRLLDIGVRSFLIPFVQNADEARRVVAATRYPPKGIRGFAGTTRANLYGRVANYAARAEEEICILVQAETRQALDVVEEIAAVDGIDGIFIGPADLASSMGHLGQLQHPEVHKAILEGGARIKKAGKAAGYLSGRDDEIRMTLDAGFDFVAVGSDVGILARQCEALVGKYKGGK